MVAPRIGRGPFSASLGESQSAREATCVASASGRVLRLARFLTRSDTVEIARQPVITIGEAAQCIAADEIACPFRDGAHLFGLLPVLVGLTCNGLVHAISGVDAKHLRAIYTHN